MKRFMHTDLRIISSVNISAVMSSLFSVGWQMNHSFDQTGLQKVLKLFTIQVWFICFLKQQQATLINKKQDRCKMTSNTLSWMKYWNIKTEIVFSFKTYSINLYLPFKKKKKSVHDMIFTYNPLQCKKEACKCLLLFVCDKAVMLINESVLLWPVRMFITVSEKTEERLERLRFSIKIMMNKLPGRCSRAHRVTVCQSDYQIPGQTCAVYSVCVMLAFS